MKEQKLLSQIRELFLSSLRASYWAQIEDGVVPKGSFVGRQLLSSVEFALDSTEEGLEDLAKLHLPFTEDGQVKESAMARRLVAVMSYFPVVLQQAVGVQNKRFQISDWVYLASCFIEGHKKAQGLCHQLVGSNGVPLPEVQRILSESMEEMAMANDFLNSVALHVCTLTKVGFFMYPSPICISIHCIL